ncbi:MAG: hypothetical protein AAF961_03745 [Planctomycetota bacterium]
MTIAVAIVSVSPCSAAEQQPATTSDAARQDALRSISLRRIDPAYREAIKQVLADTTLYRRLPTTVVDCRPAMFTFLTQNPEVLVEVWRVLGLSNAELVRTEQRKFRFSDGGGTTGDLVIVEEKCDAAAQNRIVMYARGQYEGKPFSRPLSAECVLLLRSGSMKERSGRPFVAARLDSFVRFDRRSLELIAKAVHPWVGRTADRNFTDTLTFVSNFSFTAERRPEAIDRLAGELRRVDAQRRSGLSTVALECSQLMDSTAIDGIPVAIAVDQPQGVRPASLAR